MEKKITIKDIAKLADVSKATVSFYLNGRTDKMSEDTWKRIAKIIEKTGYTPNTMARSLNSKQTHLIGVIIGDITNSFANQIVKGIEDYASQEGYQLIIGSSLYNADKEQKCIGSMSAMGVDGFIVQPTVYFETIWKQRNRKKPVVYFDSPTRDTGDAWVKTNNYEAVYEACDELIDCGYQRFLLVGADPKVLATRAERYAGFKDDMELRNIPYDALIADDSTTAEELKQKLMPFLQTKDRLCVVVLNNWLLTKTYQALADQRERIPDHLGLIGFDSQEWAQLASPSVTAIVQPAYQEGYKAAKILIDRIESRNEEPPNQILKCHMSYGDSTVSKKNND